MLSKDKMGNQKCKLNKDRQYNDKKEKKDK